MNNKLFSLSFLILLLHHFEMKNGIPNVSCKKHLALMKLAYKKDCPYKKSIVLRVIWMQNRGLICDTMICDDHPMWNDHFFVNQLLWSHESGKIRQMSNEDLLVLQEQWCIFSEVPPIWMNNTTIPQPVPNYAIEALKSQWWRRGKSPNERHGELLEWTHKDGYSRPDECHISILDQVCEYGVVLNSATSYASSRYARPLSRFC